jgi:hypothetical protein
MAHKSPAILSRAADYAYSQEVCGDSIIPMQEAADRNYGRFSDYSE